MYLESQFNLLTIACRCKSICRFTLLEKKKWYSGKRCCKMVVRWYSGKLSIVELLCVVSVVAMIYWA